MTNIDQICVEAYPQAPKGSSIMTNRVAKLYIKFHYKVIMIPEF